MGGCYSADSHEAFNSPRHKLPTDRPTNKKNGKVESDAYGVKSSLDEEETLLRTKSIGINCANEEVRVVPSDSGIGSLAPNSIKDETESPSRSDFDAVGTRLSASDNKSCDQDWYNRPSDADIEKQTSDSSNENDTIPLQTYCSCGPRHAGKSSWQSNKCKTHVNSPKSYRHSDVTGLKSSFRDFMRKTEKRVRLSWKSSDSLDINKQMTTHLDRTKSEQSEIFKDDISFCAPLAKFDSIGCSLDFQNSNNRISTVTTASEIEAVARDICNCEFYATNLASELDSLVSENDKSLSVELINTSAIKQSSSPGIESEQNELNKSKNTTDLNVSEGGGEYCVKNRILSSENRVVKQVSLASLTNIRSSLSSLGDVTMTKHDGKDMVIIDAETYTQILEELSLLKTKLSQLTTVIQEDPVLDEAFQIMDACQLNFSDNSPVQEEVDSETNLSS